MSNKIKFMRDEDITIVNENIDNIIEKARNREIQIIEPTLSEFNKVKSIILNFIKKEKRIIYGGYAWNTLVKKISPNDAFYSDTAYTDVEFYSNKPIEDLKKICDILHDKKFKFIQGKSAQHDDTYTIFVNFTAYCDISYMPSNIYFNTMTVMIDGYKLIHPKFIMIDILRQFTDPLTSYWRLDKNIKRGKLMIKNYPLELSTQVTNIEQLNQLSELSIDIINNLLQYLTTSKTLLFIGQIAFNTYKNPIIDIANQTSIYDQTIIELISTNLLFDIKNIYNLIIKYLLDEHKLDQANDKLILEQYYPFFQFTDKKAVFKFNGKIFLIIYGNNEKCIPYNNILLDYNNKLYLIKIPTFNYVFMINLIKFHQAYTDKDKPMQKLQDYIMFQLLQFRNNYLKSNKQTILDQTIFEDFKVNCLGDPVSPMRKFMLSRKDRKLMPKSAIYPYDPEERRENYPIDIYNFYNYSGNIINNPKDLIFNPKKH
jgi:hypothetical protein